MRTAAAAIAEAEAMLSAASIEAPRREARLLLAHVLTCDANLLALENDRPVSDDRYSLFQEVVARRTRHEPFAYIAGRREFWSLDLEVSPATLIPRPETEILVDAVLKRVGHRMAPAEILDLGTGSGAILIALLTEMPNASGLGVDVDLEAIAVAQRNTVRHGVGARARISRSSWWSHVRGVFDIVVSNPPYIASAAIGGLADMVKDHEPRLALDGGPDGLGAYRAITSAARNHLTENGLLGFEVGQGQAADVAAMMRVSGFDTVEITADLAGIPRVVTARRV